jgi:Zn-dependent peptidase ImmA (M78 family)
VAFRRGFKTESSNLAREVRQELGVAPLDRLDPRKLAKHLDIPILLLSELVVDAPSLNHLLTNEPDAFSAVTVFCGTRRTIVHNDGHAPARRNSNVSHELSHGLLHHPPTPALDAVGCRIWNQDIEDEAGWLAGELLVTFEAAMAVARQEWTMTEATRRLRVSQDMVRFRVNMSGARTIVKRATASRRAG